MWKILENIESKGPPPSLLNAQRLNIPNQFYSNLDQGEYQTLFCVSMKIKLAGLLSFVKCIGLMFKKKMVCS